VPYFQVPDRKLLGDPCCLDLWREPNERESQGDQCQDNESGRHQHTNTDKERVTEKGSPVGRPRIFTAVPFRDYFDISILIRCLMESGMSQDTLPIFP
jgi:hypothetical protein